MNTRRRRFSAAAGGVFVLYLGSHAVSWVLAGASWGFPAYAFLLRSGLIPWAPVLFAVALCVRVGRREAPWAYLVGWLASLVIATAHAIATPQDYYSAAEWLVALVKDARVWAFNGGIVLLLWLWTRMVAPSEGERD